MPAREKFTPLWKTTAIAFTLSYPWCSPSNKSLLHKRSARHLKQTAVSACRTWLWPTSRNLDVSQEDFSPIKEHIPFGLARALHAHHGQVTRKHRPFGHRAHDPSRANESPLGYLSPKTVGIQLVWCESRGLMAPPSPRYTKWAWSKHEEAEMQPWWPL